ncbi:MAG TPA: pitrilysin family protein [Gemmatimonadota bacterium]|nr:pitrilysin family protein [Gemmatimonadota bacterium]
MIAFTGSRTGPVTGLMLAFMLVLVTAPDGRAQRQTPPPGGTPEDFRLPETRTFTLENGLGVTLAPYGWLPKTTVQLVLGTGNINETRDQVWLADITGDLMMEGTISKNGQEIALAAAAMGGEVDVTVGPDETTVGGNALSEYAPDLLGLIADIARNPAFPPDELDRLKADRIRQVTIARSQPQNLTLERFRAILYADHPYGRVYPTPEMLTGYTIEGIRSFYDANYGAQRAHVYVAGRFDEAAVEAAVREAFGDWPAGPPGIENVPSPASEREIHLLDRPGAVQSTVYIGLPVIDPSDPDYLALQVTNTLLGGSFNSRITSNIRETKGYTYSPFSQVSSRFRDAYWVQVADVTTAVTGPSLEEIFHEIDRLQAEPPTEPELEGIQNYMAGTFVLTNSSPSGIIGVLRFLNLHGLGRDYLTDYVQNVYAVTPEEVRRMAVDVLEDEEMVIVIAGDETVIREQVSPFGEIVGEESPPLRVE